MDLLEALEINKEEDINRILQDNSFTESYFNEINSDGCNSSLVALSSNHNLETLRSLAIRGANFNIVDQEGNNAIHHFAFGLADPQQNADQQKYILNFLLSQPLPISINHENSEGQRPLDIMLNDSNQNHDLIKCAVENGAIVDEKTIAKAREKGAKTELLDLLKKYNNFHTDLMASDHLYSDSLWLLFTQNKPLYNPISINCSGHKIEITKIGSKTLLDTKSDFDSKLEMKDDDADNIRFALTNFKDYGTIVLGPYTVSASMSELQRMINDRAIDPGKIIRPTCISSLRRQEVKDVMVID